MQTALQRSWGFACTCAICLDNTATVVAERHRIRDAASRLFVPGSTLINTRKASKLVDKLEATYTRPAHEVPRILLWDLQAALATAYIDKKQWADALAWARKALISIGFLVAGADALGHEFKVLQWGQSCDQLMDTFLVLCTVFLHTGLPKNAEYAYACAKMSFRIAVGEDDTFENIYPSMEEMKTWL